MILAAAMMVLALLSLLVIAGVAASSLEVKIAGHDRDAKQAFYLCEAGLEKTRYEVIKGWGKGSPSVTTNPFQFDFDSATMPDVVKVGGAIGWAANQWVNFTLSDQGGARYAVTGNTAAYEVTCTGAGTTAPQAGRAGLHYANDAVAYFGLSGAGGALTMTDATATWGPGIWAGFALLDVNGAEFSISGNNNTTLNVDGTPASGQFWIVRGVRGADKFTLYENPLNAAQVGAPNQQWRDAPHTFGTNLWYLRDRTGALFAITDTDYYSAPNRMELTVDGTPASGAFELTTNPWLVAVPTVTYDNSAAGFLPPLSGTDYGSVTVTVTPGPQPGFFTLLARSGNTTTAVGDVQEIRLSARLGAGGSVLVSDWRQGP